MIETSNTAVFIHTFLRDGLMERCVESVKKHLPGARIYLSDGGRMTSSKTTYYARLRNAGHWVEHYDEYNVWWRKVFNEKAKIANEEYIIKVDDDFYFSPTSNATRLISMMDQWPDLALLGARVYHQAREEDSKYIYQVTGVQGDKYVLDYAPAIEFGWAAADFVPDFWIARRGLFDVVQMDPNLKPAMGGHEKFFTDIYEARQKNEALKKHMRIGYTTEVVAYHEKSHESAEYKQERASGFADYHKISKVIKPKKPCS